MMPRQRMWRALRLTCYLIVGILLACCKEKLEAQSPEGGQTLWNLERSYWHYVEDNNLPAYTSLWHEKFLGWPYISAAPVRKDHITDWITTQTAKGLRLKTVDFKPAAIQVTGDIGVTCYWISYKWVDKGGDGAVYTMRITHTFLKEGKDWHIIGGMSAPEGALP